MKIAIIGTGNAGCAHAYKLTELGHHINLIKTSQTLHEDNFNTIIKQGGIYGIDNTENARKGFQKINLITRNIELGLKGVDLILIMTQSLYHDQIAKKIAPHIDLESTKIIFSIPGNLGSLFFRKEIGASGIIYAEGESTPYDARIIKPGLINILFKNVRNAVAFLPNSKKCEGMAYISQLVDTYGDYRTNIIESALHNPNLIVHTIGVIMSANRIEKMKGEFWMYQESFSPSIWNLITQLDKEKNDVITSFGGEAISYLEACKYRNEKDLNKNPLEVFQSYADNGGPKGPDSLNTRYLHEDVIVGLGLLSTLGQESKINTPLTNSLITIASYLVDKDFHALKRSKKDFGIENLSKDELFNLIN